MATNKKITELTELEEADLADDDVLPIVDISAGQTFKVRKSTLASALAGVASIAATTPVAVDQATGSVTVSLDTVPIASGGTGATTAAGARTNLGAISDPTDTRGDIITRGASALQKLGLGASGYFLKSDGTDPTWSQVAASELTGSVDLTSQVTGTLPLANGGTNSTTASGARTSLGAAASGANTDITSLAADIVISGSTSGDALRITQTGAGNALVVEDSSNPDSTPTLIDASGDVIIGHTTQQTGAGGVSTRVQVLGGTGASGSQNFVYSATGTASSVREFLKSSSGSIGTNSVVASGETLGVLRWSGADGTNFIRSAEISAFVDGTPGTNDMPGRLVFSTTADGASSPTERMRIESDGGVKVVNAAYNSPTTDNDLSFDQAATNNFTCTPTGTGTLTFTNHTAGQSGNILLDNSGGHAISLAATTKGDANLATTISTAGTYWLSYYDDGTNAYVVTSAVFA
jgi:hypothetical protein